MLRQVPGCDALFMTMGCTKEESLQSRFKDGKGVHRLVHAWHHSGSLWNSNSMIENLKIQFQSVPHDNLWLRWVRMKGFQCETWIISKVAGAYGWYLKSNISLRRFHSKLPWSLLSVVASKLWVRLHVGEVFRVTGKITNYRNISQVFLSKDWERAFLSDGFPVVICNLLNWLNFS